MKFSNLLKTGILAGALTLGGACKKGSSVEHPVELSKEDREVVNNLAVLNYLADPKFAGKDFAEQVTGTKAKLEVYDLDEKKAYFSINTNNFNDETLENLTLNTNGVEFGKTDFGEFAGGKVRLGEYDLNDPSSYFFRIPENNFRVNQKRILSIPFGNITYNQSIRELSDFILNESVHGGFLKAFIEGKSDVAPQIMINHGAFVAKKGEPSLTRLVNSIVKPYDSDEVISQKLLDFVTGNMKYDYGDIVKGLEVMRRPNEVLMNRGSDCSGLTILYSSLLEQKGITHQLVYYPNHINVAVAGNFPNENGYAYELSPVKYSIAEPTNPGFKIGKTRLNGFDMSKMRQIQTPGKNSPLFDAKTGDQLPFR